MNSTKPRISLRPATDEDFGAVRQLLAERDARDWLEEDVRWLFHGLDPTRCVAWIAFDHDRPVGFTGLFLRTLTWRGEKFATGYWTNLYVSPGYAGAMLYPRLPLAMFDWAKEHSLAFLYAAVRRHKVAQTHLAIGFAKIGELETQFRLLRPARLFAKDQGLGRWFSLLAAPLDGIFRGWLSLRRIWRPRLPVGTDEPVDPLLSNELVILLQSASSNQLVQDWSPESFEYRYHQTTDGEQYRALVARAGADAVAAIVYRFAVHGNGIRLICVMDAFCRPDSQPLLVGLLEQAVQLASRGGCELVLSMAAHGASAEQAFRRCGFRSTPERYDLLIWPAQALQRYPCCGAIANWRFSMGDHDAF